MSTVLIVDDVAAVAEQYAYDLKRLGKHETLTATGGAPALEVLTREAVDCMILDLEMPGMDGFAVLEALEARGIDIPVIVYTGAGNFDRCVRAVRLGAFGFIDKAEPMERVVQEVANALRTRRLASEVTHLRRRLGEESTLLGESAAMSALRAALARVAPIPSPVLVVGESGTGKELVAREIHRLSGRSAEPFFPLNCAALPENLVESELFGHERGAFTGADRLRPGAFEAAGAGTLFLDEIGELPLSAQAKLLRVLEEQTVRRLGGNRAVPVAARVVAATHRDLDAEAQAARFREDLFYRINVHVIRVPALRERREDVPLLVEHFLATLARRFGMRPKTMDPRVVEILTAQVWARNNVRELRNVVERMLLAAGPGEIGVDHLPAELLGKGATLPVVSAPGKLKDLKHEAERRFVVAALERHGWHVTRAAEELGLTDHAALHKILRRHGITRKPAE